MYKLPVWQTIKEGLGFIWIEKRAWFDYALIPVIVATAIPIGLALWLFGTPGFGFGSDIDVNRLAESFDFIFVIAIVLSVVVSLWVYIAFAVAWHRRYLLGPQNSSARELIQWGSRHWLFLGRSFVYFIVVITAGTVIVLVVNSLIGILLVQLGGIGVALSAVLTVIVFLYLFVQIVGLSLAFPAAAVEDSDVGFGAAWRLAKGNRWRMFGIIVLGTFIPTFIVQFVLLAILTAITLALGMTVGVNATPSISASIILEFVAQAINLLGIAIGVSMLSIMYRRLRDNVPLDAKETA